MAKQSILLGELMKSAVAKLNENFTELYEHVSLITNKVDKEAGKGLSENDYTTAEKNKLAGIDSAAQVNVLEGVKVNGTTLTPTDKVVNIDLSSYAQKTDISSVYKYKGSVASVSELPTTNNTTGDVYNVLDTDMNYSWTGSEWDPLGSVTDLSDYVKTTQMNTALENKVDKVTGKGLSTNDYTTDEKNKLASLSAPVKNTFVASNWGTATDSYYTMTIATTKYPMAVFRKNGTTYDMALVQCSTDGTNVTLTSEEAFEGYVILV